MAWNSLIRETTGRGVTVGRVRVVTIPHSDYHRWLLTETADNVAAGEDIRYLPRQHVDTDKVPHDDFWLFDDERIGFNLTDIDGRPVGAALTTDPTIVTLCRGTKELLWSMATPFAEYVTV